MVLMVARLRIVLLGLLVASLGGCGGGSQATSPPDAPTVMDGNGGSAGTGGGPGGVGGGSGGTGGQLATTTSAAPGVCVPGASVACACVTGQQGAQVCTAAGTFAACVCAAPTVDAGATGGSGGSTGAAGSGTDGIAGAGGMSGGGDTGGSSVSSASSGGLGGSGGIGGAGGGPVVDAAADQSVDVPVGAQPDTLPAAQPDTGCGAEINSFTVYPSSLPYSLVGAQNVSNVTWVVTGDVKTVTFTQEYSCQLPPYDGVWSKCSGTMSTIPGSKSVLPASECLDLALVQPCETYPCEETFTLTVNGTCSKQVTLTVQGIGQPMVPIRAGDCYYM
jgi:hypothetical protein